MAIKNGVVRMMDTVETEREGATHDNTREETARLPDIAYVILGHVGVHADGIHGYQLGRLLSRSALRLPALRLGQLYRVLRRLERAHLVDCHVEAESARLRYRFAITPRGEACLQEWLGHIPRGSAATCQQLLYRLRFANRLPGTVLLRLVDEAVHECRSSLEEMSQRSAAPRDEHNDRPGPYEASLKARLATDLCWLEEVRRVVQRSVADSAKVRASA